MLNLVSNAHYRRQWSIGIAGSHSGRRLLWEFDARLRDHSAGDARTNDDPAGPRGMQRLEHAMVVVDMPFASYESLQGKQAFHSRCGILKGNPLRRD